MFTVLLYANAIFTIAIPKTKRSGFSASPYAALLPRRGPHYASHCLSVRPVIVTERHVAPPSELQ